MRQFQFEILADGSIGKRYYFDVNGDVPDQAVRAGATLHTERMTPDLPPQREAAILEAHVKPEAYRVQGGKMEKRTQQNYPRARG